MPDSRVKEHLVIKAGSVYSRVWPVTGLDLTGATARSQVRATAASADVLADLNPTVDTVEGQIQIEIEGADSLAWEWTDGVFDLFLTDSTGTDYAIVEGKIKVIPAVTR